MMQTKLKKIIGLSLITTSVLYGASSNGEYSNLYGSFISSSSIMSDSEYTSYGSIPLSRNISVGSDGEYSNYANVEILNSGELTQVPSNGGNDSNTEGSNNNTGNNTTTPPVTSTDPETPEEEEDVVEPETPDDTTDNNSTTPDDSDDTIDVVIPDNPNEPTGPDTPTEPTTPVVPKPSVPDTPTTQPDEDDTVEPEEPNDTQKPERPVIEDIIDDDGNFDEDPTDSNIDVVIITEDGNASKQTINTIDTGKEIAISESSESNATTKKFVLELTDTNTSAVENREIIVENPNATSTATDTGFQITASSEDENQTLSCKIELNTNGTSVSSLIITDKESGEKKKCAVSSFRADANTTVADDGSITLKSESVEATINSDGSTEHSVVANGKETKAISKANNTITAILEDGTVQTRTSVVNDNNHEVTVSVDGKSDGKSIHLLKITDENGNEKVTKAESEIAGAITSISEDGSVETSVTTDNNVEMKVSASTDGVATHSVSFRSEDGSTVNSTARSMVPGTQTTVTSEGKIVTEATVTSTNDSGEQFEVKAIAETNEDGTTSTRFERVNLTTGETEQLNNTVSANTPFEEGNEVEVEELEDIGLQIKVRTKATQALEIE